MEEIPIPSAWRLLYPSQVVLVTSVDKDGKPNIITLGWSMHASFDPPLVAISVGKTRHSHKLISECGEFVLAFPNKDMGKEVLYCGTHSGRNSDKFKESGLKPSKAKMVKPPLIKDCVVNFECRVVKILDTGDHTIFIGEILKAHSSGRRDILLDFGGYRFGSV